MCKRDGVTLIEVLVAIFVMGIGLLALLTLFPLGVFSMQRAIQDERCAQASRIIGRLQEGVTTVGASLLGVAKARGADWTPTPKRLPFFSRRAVVVASSVVSTAVGL